MGYVVRAAKRVNVRIDNYQIITNEQKGLVDQNLIQKRDNLMIMIYPDANDEFDDFYAKHVARTYGKGRVSILVADGECTFDKDLAKLLLEEALRKVEITNRDFFAARIPQIKSGHTFSVRNWDYSVQQFTSNPKDCCFIFRDIKDVSSRKALFGVKKYLSTKEFNTILDYIDNAKNPDEIYIISKVLFIGKYYVAAAV